MEELNKKLSSLKVRAYDLMAMKQSVESQMSQNAQEIQKQIQLIQQETVKESRLAKNPLVPTARKKK